ncbi:MAG TPA: lamin tail domain-containing protein [Acidimicrobiia bacterium]|nr:lamin tail domain-containing protein [Acidimicrobiia bacterium]
MAVLSVGVAGASSEGSKSAEQAGRTTEPTQATAVTTAEGSGGETTSTSGPAGEATTTTGAAASTTAPPGSTATTGPRATSTTKPTATTTTTRPAPAGDPTAVLAGLRVAPEGARTGYSRDLFNHWVDEDGDGCDTREEVLIAESRSQAQVDPYGCKVVAGDWFSAYDGLSFSDPSELDIDHMVALAEAWDSGASGWDASRRRAFANDLGHPEALAAVSASSNRSKSDLDPGQWKPTRDAAWCQYARDWVTVKKAWDLSADQNEVDDLKVMLRTCDGSSPGGGAPAPTASSTTTTTTSPPTGGTVTVTALDCQGEAVTVRNGGSVPADLTGWSIHDEGIKHTYKFPAGYSLAPGASVTIRSGGPAGSGELGWTGSSVWNNDGDTAHLLNAGGAVVSTRSC